jgi:Mg/Co/Ni transporter MgtE
MSRKQWMALCFSWPIVRRALIAAAIVGIILTFINHGGALLSGQLDASILFQIGLTFIVPYVVSTVSSVTTILNLEKQRPGQ